MALCSGWNWRLPLWGAEPGGALQQVYRLISEAIICVSVNTLFMVKHGQSRKFRAKR
jgi:hypothetical protein